MTEKLRMMAAKLVNSTAHGKELAVWLRDITKTVWYGVFYALRYPVDKRMILFESYWGRQFACSPRAVYEELCRSSAGRKYKIVWAFEEPERFRELFEGRKNVRLVKYHSREHIRCYARAGFWITNSRTPAGIWKKRGQIYVQTWHGTPLKKIGCDVVNHQDIPAANRRTHRYYRKEGRQLDYLVSPSAFYTEKLGSALDMKRMEGRVLEVGYPRNDCLFTFTDADAAALKEELGILGDKKVILYAPTWRENQHEAGVGYTYRMGLDLKGLKQELASEYVILFRVHYMVRRLFDFAEYEGFLYDVSDYSDISRLYTIADMLVTDYSSVFFDYANLKRPMLFYMYDFQEYKEELRDFYFDISLLPGPVIKEEADLGRAIRKLDGTFVYDERYQAFNERFNPHPQPCSRQVLKKCGILKA